MNKYRRQQLNEINMQCLELSSGIKIKFMHRQPACKLSDPKILETHWNNMHYLYDWYRIQQSDSWSAIHNGVILLKNEVSWPQSCLETWFTAASCSQATMANVMMHYSRKTVIKFIQQDVRRFTRADNDLLMKATDITVDRSYWRHKQQVIRNLSSKFVWFIHDSIRNEFDKRGSRATNFSST